MRLSNNFTLEELTKSQTASRFNIDNTPSQKVIENLKFLTDEILQPLRDRIQKPIIITSGYRSTELNKKIGGSNKSQHILGQAADIECPYCSTKRLADIIHEHLPYDQLILECHDTKIPNSGWVHVSLKLNQNRKEYLIFDGKQYRSVK